MSLTPAQRTTFKTNRAANTNTIQAFVAGQGDTLQTVQIKDVADVGDNYQKIANWYNLDAAGPWIVWRDLATDKVLGLITYASMTPLDAIPSVTALPAAPTAAQTATYNNQVATVHIWNARSISCQGKQFNLQNLTIGRETATMRNTSYRAAIQDCLTNLPAGASGALIAANWVGVRDAAKFNASNLEKLFSTGTGSSAVPADLVFEGMVSEFDVRDAILNG